MAAAAECRASLTQLWNAARTRSHAGKNVPSVTLSVGQVKRSACINEENLKLILLCSDGSLQTVWFRSLLTTQELFTPEESQWIKCMNTRDEQLLAYFIRIFFQGLKPWNLIWFKNYQRSPKKKNKVKAVFSFLYQKAQQDLAERTPA